MSRIWFYLGLALIAVLLVIGCAAVEQPAGQQGWADVRSSNQRAVESLIYLADAGANPVTINIGNVNLQVEQGRVTSEADSSGESAHSGTATADNKPQTDATVSLPLVP